MMFMILSLRFFLRATKASHHFERRVGICVTYRLAGFGVDGDSFVGALSFEQCSVVLGVCQHNACMEQE